MPPAAPRRAPRTSWLAFAAVAAAVVAARLPFLLHGSRFFDSDEAVEGLMARHVLDGQLPLFLWGQRYKGVPEVYLTAAAFRVWPASVITLKAVTLAGFAVYACLNFKLVADLFSRRVAWLTTAFLVVGPPSLVLWTLSGSAEVVMTFLAGTSLLLGLNAWHRTGSRAGLITAAAALGLGLWIQQYALYYVASIAAAIALSPSGWRPAGRAADFFRSLPAWLRIMLALPALAAGLYVVLGFVAFAGPGLAISPFGLAITVTDPQKMWWIAAGLMLIAAAGFTSAWLIRMHEWRGWIAPGLAFFAGYSPAIAGRLLSEGPGSPMARMDLRDMTSALPEFSSVAVPMLFGFRSPTTELLAVPAWAGLAIVAVVIISYGCLKRLRSDEHNPLFRVFHFFVFLAPVLFAASGSYIDPQSYRYLVPMYAALPVVYAVGIEGALRLNRIAGLVLLAALVSMFAVQQWDWYRRLEPDREASTIVACLDTTGIRAAHADYWLSYKLTFLTGERVIVAPVNGPDRYPPYTAAVQAVTSAPTIGRVPPGGGDPPPCSALIR
jgi:hypothetical protein